MTIGSEHRQQPIHSQPWLATYSPLSPLEGPPSPQLPSQSRSFQSQTQDYHSPRQTV
ncbi:hypothetical protein DEO72_LG8g1182 [Vigna unguiculata]|uniref:Uncharacterized protein n=1 Tax=Vigna unguiculata TaxID=3917 RepID=A0A4D6MNQ7_VIGUN|nr:hypothetical protein DEO72_LG8g1182 [Vigna unguiculata]